MRIAYLNCFSGISGDMIIGALIDAGLKKERLEKELNKLNLSGYRLEVKKVVKKGISATNSKSNNRGRRYRKEIKGYRRYH